MLLYSVRKLHIYAASFLLLASASMTRARRKTDARAKKAREELEIHCMHIIYRHIISTSQLFDAAS